MFRNAASSPRITERRALIFSAGVAVTRHRRRNTYDCSAKRAAVSWTYDHPKNAYDVSWRPRAVRIIEGPIVNDFHHAAPLACCLATMRRVTAASKFRQPRSVQYCGEAATGDI